MSAQLRRRRDFPRSPARQRGIAMLVAILLVALGTILAADIAYRNAMSARRATATLSFDEALLVAQGAEAQGAPGAGGEASGEKKEDVVDAEFTEVDDDKKKSA